MISRKTGVSLLLALVIASGMALWNAEHPDNCYRYMRGDDSLPASQPIEINGQTVYAPCDQWYVRQSLAIQAACFVEVAVVGVFVVSAMGDFVDWMRSRRRVR